MEIKDYMEGFKEKVMEYFNEFSFNVYRKGNNGVVFENGKYRFWFKNMEDRLRLNLECGGRTALTLWCREEIKNGIKNPYRFKIIVGSTIEYFNCFSSLPYSIKEDYDFFALRFFNAIEVICRKHNFDTYTERGTTNICFNLYCNCIDKDTYNKEVERLCGIIEEIFVEVNTKVALEYYEKVELQKETLRQFKEQAESDKADKAVKVVGYSCYKNNKNELVIMKGNKVVATISDCPSDTRVMNALANDVLYDLGYIKEDYF